METVFGRTLALVSPLSFPVHSINWKSTPFSTLNIYLLVSKIGNATLFLHQFKSFLTMDAKNWRICIKTKLLSQCLQVPISNRMIWNNY